MTLAQNKKFGRQKPREPRPGPQQKRKLHKTRVEKYVYIAELWNQVPIVSQKGYTSRRGRDNPGSTSGEEILVGKNWEVKACSCQGMAQMIFCSPLERHPDCHPKMSSPGVEPGLSRPRRDVLTTRRWGLLVKLQGRELLKRRIALLTDNGHLVP